MSRTINTRTQYRIIGSDYSAQEPRMTTFLSGDPTMYKAYNEGKDLYAMIAMSAYNNRYEDNLEFWPAGTELEIDGQKVIAGKKTHLNKAGKERRSVGKVLNLAATYGMSGRTAGIRLGYEGEEAKAKGEELLNNFFSGFGGVKEAIDSSKAFLKQYGYVEDFVGRRRRLDDINLDPYVAEQKVKLAVPANFNPILGCGERSDGNDPVRIWNEILAGYALLSNAMNKAKDMSYQCDGEMSNSRFDALKKIAANPSYMLGATVDSRNKWESRTNKQKILDDMQIVYKLIKERRYEQGRISCAFPQEESYCADMNKLIDKYIIRFGEEVPHDVPTEPMNVMAWTGRIAQASRQCFNARIQGSAATLTKMAMVDIENDPQMNAWDAHLIITVHDEVLVECPEQYADLVEKRLPELMVAAAAKAGDDVPQACDPYNVSRWYSDTAGAFMQEEFKKLEAKGMSRDDALKKIIDSHTEVPQEAIVKTIETGCDLDF